MHNGKPRLPEVVVIGGGFGGLTCAQALKHAPVNVTVVDRMNYHLFQPLLYQVAMAGLSPADIAVPIRSVVAHQANTRVLLGNVRGVDVGNRTVLLDEGPNLTYDYLVLATGARTNYFGNEEWAKGSLGLKDVDEAIEIRRRVLLAFEAAERTSDPALRQALLTFVIIGGGPTGVELAGALAELSHRVLAKDFRNIHPDGTRVILLEGTGRLLSAFDPKLSTSALHALQELGVEVRLNTRVVGISDGRVRLADETLPASSIIWAAGVRAAPLAETLPGARDRLGRVVVGPDCAIVTHPEIFVIGDAARFEENGQPLPGVAPVAMQQGRAVARNIVRSIDGVAREPFHYFDKGIMATIGRSRAVLQVGRVKMSGFVAWLAWIFVHILYLVGFRNRFIVLFSWFWSYATYKRGARLITGAPVLPYDEATVPPPSDVSPRYSGEPPKV